MKKQPEALRLADAILTNKWPQVSPIWETSQELRRLHEVNAKLFDDRNVWDEEVGERIRARGTT
jgi:hypothetical protein